MYKVNPGDASPTSPAPVLSILEQYEGKQPTPELAEKVKAITLAAFELLPAGKSDEELAEAKKRPVIYGRAGKAETSFFENEQKPLTVFMRRLTEIDPNDHEKDGECFTQFSLGRGARGESVQRQKKKVFAAEMIAFDVDSGEPPEPVIERLRALGLAGTYYETFSNGSPVSKYRADTVAQWLKSQKIKTLGPFDAIEEEDVRAYWRGTKLEELHDKIESIEIAGSDIVVHHTPFPRWRLVLPALEAVRLSELAPLTAGQGRIWANAYRRIADLLGIKLFDPSCTDLTRLYYRPRYPRGVEGRAVFFDGTPIDLRHALEDALARARVEEEERRTKKTSSSSSSRSSSDKDFGVKGLRAFVARFGDRMQVASWLETRGFDPDMQSDGAHFICSHNEEHDTTADVPVLWAIDAADAQSGTFIMKCKSGSCMATQLAKTKGAENDRLYYFSKYLRDFGIYDAAKLFEEDGLLAPEATEEEIEAFVGKSTAPVSAPSHAEVDKMIEKLSTSSELEEIEAVFDAVALSQYAGGSSTLRVEAWSKKIKTATGASIETVRASLKEARDRLLSDLDNASEENSEASPGALDAELQVAHDLNKRFAHVRIGTTDLVLVEPRDNDAKKIKPFDYTRRETFKAFYGPELGSIQIGDNRRDVVDVWLGSKHRRHHDEIVFDAVSGELPAHVLNMWRGFAVDPHPGDARLLRRHVFERLCGGDVELAIYVLSFFGEMLQNPTSNKPGVALSITGEEGTGKTTLARAIADCFPQNAITIDKSSQLVGRFNSHLEGKLLAISEEAVFQGDHAGSDALKNLITGTRIAIERKNVDVCEIDSPVRLVMLSNHEHLVRASPEARRFCVLRSDPSIAKAAWYFDPLYHEIENGGREAMLFDLLSFKAPADLDLRNVPSTEALDEQKEMSLPPLDAFIREMILEGGFEYPGDHGTTRYFGIPTRDELREETPHSLDTFRADSAPGEITCDRFREAFFARYPRERSFTTSQKIGKRLGRLGVERVPVRRGPNVYRFPALEALTKALAKWLPLGEHAGEKKPICELSPGDRELWRAWLAGEEGAGAPWLSPDYEGELRNWRPKRK